MSQPAYALPNALTSRGKVKARLGIPINDTSKDAVVDDVINQVSARIEQFCNRKFLRQAYDEQYDTDGGYYIFLKQLPLDKTVPPVVSLRGGNIAAPTWTVFYNNGYYVYYEAGYINFTGKLPRHGRQLVRVQYTAGFKIDFSNELDPAQHTLPFDLTELATNLAVRSLNTAAAQGFKLEMVEGMRQEYDFSFTENDKAIIQKYSKPRVAI